MRVGELREMLESEDADTQIITGYESSEEGEGFIVVNGVEKVTLENGATVINFTQQEVQDADDVESGEE